MTIPMPEASDPLRGHEPSHDDQVDEQLQAAFRASCEYPPVSDEDLETFRSRIRLWAEDDKRARRHKRATPWPLRWTEETRARIYQGRIDRLISIAASAIGLCVGLLVIVYPGVASERALLAVGVTLIALTLGALTVQSGRNGFLEARARHDLEYLRSALGLRVIRGHDPVHSAEAAVLRHARNNGFPRVLVTNLWFRERSEEFTPSFLEMQREVDLYLEECPEGDLRIALAAAKRNIDQCLNFARPRVGRAKQLFYVRNPLEYEVVMSDGEAIISFGRRGTDRDFAFHVTNASDVRELWKTLDAELTGRGDIEVVPLSDDAAVDDVYRRVSSFSAAAMHSPQSWDSTYESRLR